MPVRMQTATTPRQEIARLAFEAASRTPGVVGPAPDPARRWSTRYGETMLRGVVCMPVASGGYSVGLHLFARLVPLLPLADEIRGRVERAVKRGGLAGELRRIDVAFEDIAGGEMATS